MKKDEFIEFARNHEELSKSVAKGETTWQQLYELYVIYGSKSKVWDKYINKQNNNIKEIINYLKNIDVDTLQQGIENIEKTIELIKEFIPSKENDNKE